jgi:hypothetical protein
MRIPVASNIIRTAKQIVNAHTSKIDGRILSASVDAKPPPNHLYPWFDNIPIRLQAISSPSLRPRRQ